VIDVGDNCGGKRDACVYGDDPLDAPALAPATAPAARVAFVPALESEAVCLRLGSLLHAFWASGAVRGQPSLDHPHSIADGGHRCF
jgi:hypothetical protein